MQKPLYDYDIYPKVVLAGKGTDIHIRPMSPALAFGQDQDYEIEILPTTESLEGTGLSAHLCASQGWRAVLLLGL